MVLMYSEETIKAIANAMEATANSVQPIAELTLKAGALVAKVIGVPAEQIGEIFTDRLRLYKYKNLCSVADSVESIHQKRRIEGKTVAIPPRLAIPLLESAALENNETLQQVWALLIANSTDPNFKPQLHPGFIEVVKQLSPDEAILLNLFRGLKRYPMIYTGGQELDAVKLMENFLHNRENPKRKEPFDTAYEEIEEHSKPLPIKSRSSIKVYMDNLVRLRIVEFGYTFSTTDESRQVLYKIFEQAVPTDNIVNVSQVKQEEYLKVTAFGQMFIAACISDTD